MTVIKGEMRYWFDSRTEAARFIGCKVSDITNVLAGLQHVTKGHFVIEGPQESPWPARAVASTTGP